jgi:hypothetical protein
MVAELSNLNAQKSIFHAKAIKGHSDRRYICSSSSRDTVMIFKYVKKHIYGHVHTEYQLADSSRS